jgi:hypothetical protein
MAESPAFESTAEVPPDAGEDGSPLVGGSGPGGEPTWLSRVSPMALGYLMGPIALVYDHGDVGRVGAPSSCSSQRSTGLRRGGTASIRARPLSPKNLSCQETGASGTSIRGPTGLVAVLKPAQPGAPDRQPSPLALGLRSALPGCDIETGIASRDAVQSL